MKHLLLLIAGFVVSTPLAFTQTTPSTNGLQVWLEAGQNVTKGTGNAVSSWGSLITSPSFSADQATASRQPIWIEHASSGGQSTIQFDGVNDRLQLNEKVTAITSSLTAFVTFSLTSLNSSQMIFDTKNGTSSQPGYYLQYRNNNSISSLQVRIIHPNTNASGPSPYPTYSEANLLFESFLPDGYSENDFITAMIRVDSGDVGYAITLRVGDVEYTSTSTNPDYTFTDISGHRNITFGQTSSLTDALPLNGNISNFLLYNRALGDEEAGSVLAYLSAQTIPEPGTAALLLLAPALLLLSRRAHIVQ